MSRHTGWHSAIRVFASRIRRSNGSRRRLRSAPAGWCSSRSSQDSTACDLIQDLQTWCSVSGLSRKPRERREQKMTTVRSADGISISYNTLGDGPRNLLFMHGWAGSGSYWDEMLKHLDLGGLRVIAYDMRGHGDSDRADTGF